MLGSGDVLAAMNVRRELGAVVLVRDVRVGLEHRLQSLDRVSALTSNLRELGEMRGDLALMPGEHDRFDV